MYITVKSLKKTLGKYIEMTDLYIGLPSLILFLILFLIGPTRMISIIFLVTVLFLMIPINLSKKNGMYKVMYLVFRYIFKCKEFIYLKESVDDEGRESTKKSKKEKNNKL